MYDAPIQKCRSTASSRSLSVSLSTCGGTAIYMYADVHYSMMRVHQRDMGLGLRGVTTLPEYFKLRGYASVGMGKIFHPVPDKVTGLIDDWCTPTMHNCSWTAMASKGGQPYFHGRLEKYYQNGNIDPSNSTCLAGL